MQRIRRGAYASPGTDQSVEELHRQLIFGTLPQFRREGVLSYGSAAVMHGLPVWSAAVDRVHVTRTRAGGGIRRHLVEIHTSPLAQHDVVQLGGVEVTSLARTIVDLARTLPYEQSVAAGDRALALGLRPYELDQALTEVAGWPGVRWARRVAGFLDERSESVGESVSRVRMAQSLIPAPELQYEVFDDTGALVGRCDFAWPDLRTLGEFDGKIKYGRLLRPGETIEEAVYREKRREDALRDLGWQVVRWIWKDLYEFGAIRARLDRAFVRGTGRTR